MVLLTGESGTGRSLVARMIHDSGPLSEKLFVSINCSALPHDLMESELFGQEKRSLANVDPKCPGFIEIAHGGTLFLDEMGDIPPQVQAKLLTFLREKTFCRVGGKKSVHARVRINRLGLFQPAGHRISTQKTDGKVQQSSGSRITTGRRDPRGI